GSPWSHPVQITPPDDSHFYLDEEDEYKLDLDVLNWILTKNRLI
ncbi:hypothetical protein LCGC14_3126610, partial [marine sediment metagenome]